MTSCPDLIVRPTGDPEAHADALCSSPANDGPASLARRLYVSARGDLRWATGDLAPSKSTSQRRWNLSAIAKKTSFGTHCESSSSRTTPKEAMSRSPGLS